MSEPIQTPRGTEEVQPETEIKPVEPQPPAQPEPDYKEKFSQSSSENQILRDRIKVLEEGGQDLTKEPTDSDLRAAFPEWDSLDDFNKGIARRTYNAERLATVSARQATTLTAEQSWNTSIELAVSSNPALQGREQTFRQFAMKPQYRGASMELLVDAFLQRNPAAPLRPATPKPGLETGNGGPRETPKPQTLSTAELTALRTTDPKAYQDYLKTHDVSIDV